MIAKKATTRRQVFDRKSLQLFRESVAELTTIKDEFSEIARGARLALDHEIVLNGPQGHDGLVQEVHINTTDLNGEGKEPGLKEKHRANTTLLRLILFAVGVLIVLHAEPFALAVGKAIHIQ